MKIKKTIYAPGVICFICLVTFSLSCKKDVTVAPPVSSLSTANVFDNDNTAIAAMLSIYAQMQNDNYDMHRDMGLSSDELTNFANDASSQDIYKNSLNITNEPGSIAPWNTYYQLIYQANAIIENLKNSAGVSIANKKQLSAEAKFVRAYLYFYLVNSYGDVPLALTTDYTVNAHLARTSKSKVYEQIVADLKNAEDDLSNTFVDGADNPGATDRIRPCAWAAAALLARTYLYTTAYMNAETEATKVINNSGLFILEPDLNIVFSKDSKEAIWQIQPSSYTNATAEGNSFILVSPPNPDSHSNSTSISNNLLNAFEAGDQRKTSWISSFSSGGNTWYFPYKYKDNNAATALNEYDIKLRLSEVYLIRAEAEAYGAGAGIEGAIGDLNKIRNRAGLSNYTGPIDQASLLAAILHERQVELFTEGHRWLDLKRTNTVDAVMGGSAGACQAKGGTWHSYQQLYPIPLTDILLNSNLTQNFGY